MSAPLLDHLSRQIRAIETSGRTPTGKSSLSTGCLGLDAKLPRRGYEPGTIVEWLEPSGGSGGWYLALAAARQSVTGGDQSDRDSKYWIVVDRKKCFYPPAAQAMGLPLERLIVLHPNNQADEAWAVDQALRCSAVGAVVAEIETVSELQARRFQLAAEQGQTLGLFLRPARVRNQPSWAEIQWLISQPIGSSLKPSCASSRVPPPKPSTTPYPLMPAPSPEVLPGPNPDACASRLHARPHASSTSHRRIEIQALRMRGGTSGQRWTLTVDLRLGHIALEEPYAVSSSLCLASQLAMPKGNRHERNRACPTTVRAASA